MQLPMKLQWWSNLFTQLSHHLQCEDIGGLMIMQVSQNLYLSMSKGEFIPSFNLLRTMFKSLDEILTVFWIDRSLSDIFISKFLVLSIKFILESSKNSLGFLFYSILFLLSKSVLARDYNQNWLSLTESSSYDKLKRFRMLSVWVML